MTFNLFGSYDLEVGDELELQYVTTILSFQRQFQACQLHSSNSIFGYELFSDIPIRSTATDDNQDCNEEATSTTINIPLLNESQNEACEGFLSDMGRRIHIVQGYVGKKKYILLYILEPSLALLTHFLFSRRPPGTGEGDHLFIAGLFQMCL